MKNLPLIFLFCISVSFVFAQKKVLDHPDFDVWNTIQGSSISTNGEYILYSLEKGEKDQLLKIRSNSGDLLFEHERSASGRFDYNSSNAIFLVKPWQDSVREMKRRKVKRDKMPNDTLAVYNLKNGSITKIPNYQSHKIPVKWGGTLAYQLKPEKSKKSIDSDTTNSVKKKAKPQNKENGYHLILRNLSTEKQDTFRYVTNYIFAREAAVLSFISTGDDDEMEPGVYVYNIESSTLSNVLKAKGKFNQLTFSKNGKRLGFILDRDTTKALVRPNELFNWSKGSNEAQLIVDNTKSPKGYLVSDKGRISFSDDENRLFFGLSTQPILQDTSLLDDEIVSVEVWTYDEPRLYTVQELQVNNDKNRSYQTVVHLDKDNKMVQLASTEFPDISFTQKRNENMVLVSRSKPYQLESQWEGSGKRDYALVDIATGKTDMAITKLRGRARMSPAGKYVFGYDEIDSTWFTYSTSSRKKTKLTEDLSFFDELNDSPDYPNSYGSAGWMENDEAIFIYDRYDIWKFSPESNKGIKLTDGRNSRHVYRYVKLDRENPFVEKGNWLLTVFDETNKNGGYAELNLKNTKINNLESGPYRYSTPIKAELGKGVMFTKQSFIDFPDIHYSDLSFKKSNRISTANPQQTDFNWGTSEIITWTSLDGIELEGLLIKPEDFDPDKKYPMIVNFYDRSSNSLHSHRPPSPGRSTISYSFYTSRGYVIFNPDVQYRIGYPGESAYNCVIPGVTSLIEKGFIDKERIGVQGHSWGGYQIAHLVTKSNIFAAAEAGAPVPNMISAYGGIRWWTGLSRQFQYEHTQSRIGGSPWEYPTRFMENSPIFFLDKVETPLLIMHNDADGHVPWYQGIEFFVSLRRLGKPSWFLNYNGEPHWPLKRQNRVDFNIRMQQFFDYYLKDAAMPKWMKDGVPAIEKGINQGYELLKK